jgi:hypothetical protein
MIYICEKNINLKLYRTQALDLLLGCFKTIIFPKFKDIQNIKMYFTIYILLYNAINSAALLSSGSGKFILHDHFIGA